MPLDPIQEPIAHSPYWRVACAKIWLPLLIGLGVPRSRRSLRLTTDRSQRAFGRPVPLPALRSRSVLECRSRGSRPPALRPKRAARDSPVGSSQRYRLSKAPNRPQIGIAASKQPFDPKPAKPEPNRDFERTPPSVVRAIFG